jgi:gas vesicle protein
MLSSFSRHFNETVFRGPETEGGGGDGGEGVVDTGGNDDGGAGDVSGGTDGGEEGGESPKLSVREQIKKSMAEASEEGVRPKRGDKTGRTDRKTTETPPVPEQQVQPPAAPAVPAPESLSKEAKEAWAKAPPEIQAAFIKREQDMAAGVQQLQQRYRQIDEAISPHTDALRQMNATPGEAVNRMFLWFKALAGKPADAFPALAQSMGIDWNRLAGTQQQAPQGTAQGTAPEIPEPVKQYVGGLQREISQLKQLVEQTAGRFGNVENNINQQNQARTEENLNLWSNGKTYFNEVRMDMAKLIETGIVPLKNGQVDLDTAYERAIYFNPEVRAKVLAEQQQANAQVQQQSRDAATTAQQTQVSRARKASVSLPASSTPGLPKAAPAKKPGAKVSVRDSLKAAIADLRDQ